jgi:hypothetical protein
LGAFFFEFVQWLPFGLGHARLNRLGFDVFAS